MRGWRFSKATSISLVPAFLASFAFAVAQFGAPSALAQVPSTVEHIDTGQGAPRGAGGRGRDHSVVNLLASFDADHDGIISDAELKEGAERAFTAADANGDGVITAFEQADWAQSLGGGGGVLANSMLFDADLNRKVTPQEFLAGVTRIAAEFRDPQTAQLKVERMMAMANKPDRVDAPPGEKKPLVQGRSGPRGRRNNDAGDGEGRLSPQRFTQL